MLDVEGGKLSDQYSMTVQLDGRLLAKATTDPSVEGRPSGQEASQPIGRPIGDRADHCLDHLTIEDHELMARRIARPRITLTLDRDGLDVGHGGYLLHWVSYGSEWELDSSLAPPIGSMIAFCKTYADFEWF